MSHYQAEIEVRVTRTALVLSVQVNLSAFKVVYFSSRQLAVSELLKVGSYGVSRTE